MRTPSGVHSTVLIIKNCPLSVVLCPLFSLRQLSCSASIINLRQKHNGQLTTDNGQTNGILPDMYPSGKVMMRQKDRRVTTRVVAARLCSSSCAVVRARR